MKATLVLFILAFVYPIVEGGHVYVQNFILDQRILKTFKAKENMKDILDNIGCLPRAIKSYTKPFTYQDFQKINNKIFIEKSELEISGDKAVFFYARATIVLKPEYAKLEPSILQRSLKSYIDSSFYSIKRCKDC